MGFNAYPALSIRQPDLGKTLATAALLKTAGLKNKLMEAKLRKQKKLNLLSRKQLKTNSLKQKASICLSRTLV